jgi:hypothetical protein
MILENRNVKALYWIIPTVIIALGIIILHSIRVKENGRKNFEVFYNSTLEGKIESIQMSVGVVYVKLLNKDHVYSFIPITSPLNKNTPFYSVAKAGAYIVKPSRVDTLKLIVNTASYVYTFQKL